MMNNVERYNHKTVIHSKTTFELRNELNNFSFDRRIKGKNDQKTFINARTVSIKKNSDSFFHLIRRSKEKKN